MAPISSSTVSSSDRRRRTIPVRRADPAAFEAFPLAADFLASPRLAETACLIADVPDARDDRTRTLQTPHRAGYAIPTILVTAYPDDDVGARP